MTDRQAKRVFRESRKRSLQKRYGGLTAQIEVLAGGRGLALLDVGGLAPQQAMQAVRNWRELIVLMSDDGEGSKASVAQEPVLVAGQVDRPLHNGHRETVEREAVSHGDPQPSVG